MILFCGPDTSPVLDWLRQEEPRLIKISEPITIEFLQANQIDWLVSHGYRHIIQADVLEALHSRAINLHISYLPWNRGADPNLWSWVLHTPKGVTIHYMDEDIDTGPIIAQAEVEFNPRFETLRTSYQTLQNVILTLFIRHWAKIKAGHYTPIPQQGKGSYHSKADRAMLADLLADEGWDTPVSKLAEYGADVLISSSFWDGYRRELDDLS